MQGKTGKSDSREKRSWKKELTCKCREIFRENPLESLETLGDFICRIVHQAFLRENQLDFKRTRKKHQAFLGKITKRFCEKHRRE